MRLTRSRRGDHPPPRRVRPLTYAHCRFARISSAMGTLTRNAVRVPKEVAMTPPAVVEADEVVERLRGQLRSVAVARRCEVDGGLPRLRGIYAWWMAPGAISRVTGPAHSAEA